MIRVDDQSVCRHHNSDRTRGKPGTRKHTRKHRKHRKHRKLPQQCMLSESTPERALGMYPG
eukprot:4680542-Prymnesium_polylepis.1